ncbi:hypothetical protein PG991_014954 [Apiospora marii]|uniref:Uncharacterized protein n=1 Tax=Apiospora marii TaxID=335849 RepID=A0ABR1R3J7_9PEZI
MHIGVIFPIITAVSTAIAAPAEFKRDEYVTTMKCDIAYADFAKAIATRDEYGITMKCDSAYADFKQKRDEYGITMKCDSAYADFN